MSKKTKVKVKVAKSPKVAKAVKKGAKAKKERKFVSQSKMATKLSPEVLALIKKADALETDIADKTEAFEGHLKKILDKLDSKSFMHPDRGPMSIMTRGKIYWRRKPTGGGT